MYNPEKGKEFINKKLRTKKIEFLNKNVVVMASFSSDGEGRLALAFSNSILAAIFRPGHSPFAAAVDPPTQPNRIVPILA
jgi:hypothetical protein